MKITRRQLRHIIKEAMDQESKDPKDLEAHYAITYAQVYLVMYTTRLSREGFDRSVDRYAGERQSPGYTKIIQALNTLIKALGEVKGETQKHIDYDYRETDSITQEAEDDMNEDFEKDAYKGIEEIERLINVQTPIGPSAVDAMNHYASSKTPSLSVQFGSGGVLSPQKVTTVTQQLIGLMRDEDVLSFLDNLAQA